jgi:hypothetical protein
MRSISKVIVGAAVAGACGYVSAATITAGDVNRYSLEGIQVAPAATNIDTGALNVVLGQAYVLNDTMELSIAGASFASAVDQASTFSCGAAPNTTTFTIVTASSSSSLLTYVANTPAGIVPGQTCVIPSLVITAGSVAGAGDITVSSVSKKAATIASFDAGLAAKIASVGNAWTVTSTTVLDGVIDVQNNRLTFASVGAGKANLLTGAAGLTAPANDEDSFAFSINVDGTRTNVAAVTGTMALTLTGSVGLGFLIDPVADTGGTCSLTGAGAATATTSVGVAATVATVNSCGGLSVIVPTVAAGLYTVSLGRGATSYTTANATVFTEQTYTAAVALQMGTTARPSAVSGSPAAGAWTINGTTVNIPYLPVNANIDLIVNIANRSTQSGPVTFTAWNASGTACTGTLGSVTANQNMSVGSTLKSALLACTGTGWAGATRATVQIVVPTPRATTAVNTSFSASDGKSRSVVVNDTNGYRP